jgi:transglutaminase-like putative cysteine protease
MLTLLLTLKLLEMHARRDLFVALLLSFFLILASFFHSQSIGVAALTLVATVALLTTQLSFQYTGASPPLGKRLRMGLLILLLAAPLTLVLFLLFPRIPGPLWGLPGDANAGRTGLSDTMAPGNISRLALSDDVAFRVKFNDPVPPKSQLYWRGVVLGDFDGRTWTQLRTRTDAARPAQLRLEGEPVRYQVTLEPHGRPWVFALDLPRNLPKLDNIPVSVSPDMQLLASQPIHSRQRYDVVSHPAYRLQTSDTPLVLQQWIELPASFNPRALQLAVDLSRRAQSHQDYINAVLRMFRDQPFRYTLEPPLLGRNAIDEFLFDTRAGFCEHYAGAFVMLMRAAGIPSRVVTGYQGGEINPADGYLNVRQSDAHAWSEVWLKDQGWVRVDPTAAVAPNRIERNLVSVAPHGLSGIFGGLVTLNGNNAAFASAMRSLRYQWDAATNAWNQAVLNYTLERQQRLLASLGFDNPDWRTLTAMMLAAGLVTISVVLLPMLWNRPRRAAIDVLYDKLCAQFARRGLPRAPHEGPHSYARRLTANDSPLNPLQKQAALQCMQLVEQLRYSAAPPANSAAISTLKSLLSRC